MKWEKRFFKGQQIFAKVNDDGELAASGGRVEIKYSEADGAKIYRAAVKNVSHGNNGRHENVNSGGSARKKSQSGRKSSRKKVTKKVGKEEYSSINFEEEVVGNDYEDVWKAPKGELNKSEEEPQCLKKLSRPEKDIFEIYTDGACSGNPGPCGSGVVIRSNDNYLEMSQYIGRGTNNIAELYAILLALNYINEFPNAHGIIHTDSSLCIGLLSKNWKPKVNKDLVLECRKRLKNVNAKFVKVKGHAGIPQNERADSLAVYSIKHRP